LADPKSSKTPSKRDNDSDDGADVDDNEEQARIGARLKEAREYVGLLQEDVASALGIPRASVSALESGKRRVTGLEVRRLARIYRKPVGWLLGEEEIELTEAEPLFRAAESLSARDRDQVLRFAEFLAAAGKPAASGRAAARPPRPPTRTADGGDETGT
jgi:transcriptional regulator with XRE-family HTH domain